jgi:hypothetical protein
MSAPQHSRCLSFVYLFRYESSRREHIHLVVLMFGLLMSWIYFSGQDLLYSIPRSRSPSFGTQESQAVIKFHIKLSKVDIDI